MTFVRQTFSKNYICAMLEPVDGHLYVLAWYVVLREGDDLSI